MSKTVNITLSEKEFARVKRALHLFGMCHAFCDADFFATGQEPLGVTPEQLLVVWLTQSREHQDVVLDKMERAVKGRKANAS